MLWPSCEITVCPNSNFLSPMVRWLVVQGNSQPLDKIVIPNTIQIWFVLYCIPIVKGLSNFFSIRGGWNFLLNWAKLAGTHLPLFIELNCPHTKCPTEWSPHFSVTWLTDCNGDISIFYLINDIEEDKLVEYFSANLTYLFQRL